MTDGRRLGDRPQPADLAAPGRRLRVMGRHARRRPRDGGAGGRHAVGAGPPAAHDEGSAAVRLLGVLDDPHRGRRGHVADLDRSAHRLHGLPQPRSPGQDGDDARRGQRRPPRARLGSGVPARDASWGAFGYDGMRHVSKYAEAVEIVMRLLRERSVTFTGEHYRMDEAEIIPRGPRPDGPPVWVAGIGERTSASRRAGATRSTSTRRWRRSPTSSGSAA